MTYNIYKKKIYINTPHKRKEKRKRNVNREEFEKKKKRKGTEYTKNVEKLSHVLFSNFKRKEFHMLAFSLRNRRNHGVNPSSHRTCTSFFFYINKTIFIHKIKYYINHLQIDYSHLSFLRRLLSSYL